MSDFLSGKIKRDGEADLFYPENPKIGGIGVQTFKRLEFSPKAATVFDAGRELWRYYHSQKNANINASFYDIREYFQGSKNGKMNAKSPDEEYNRLIGELRVALKILAKKIEPKVYEHGFLRG